MLYGCSTLKTYTYSTCLSSRSWADKCFSKSIHFLNPLHPVQGHGGLEPIPGITEPCDGQVTNLARDHTETHMLTLTSNDNLV